MPLKLDIPQETRIIKDAFNIIAFTVDLEQTKIYILYQEGIIDENGIFIIVDKLKQEDIVEPEFSEVISSIDEIIELQGPINTYDAVKNILYNVLMSHKNITGVIV